MALKEQIKIERLPKHIAIIMDGNGRWAKKQGKERIFGHQKGAQVVHEITEACSNLGVKYLTLYAFSTENWNRPKEEVDALMILLVDMLELELPTLMKNNARLMAIGDLSRLPAEAKQKFDSCIAQTAANTGLTLVLALSYSARWEITEAMKTAVKKANEDKVAVSDIDEDYVSSLLTTKDMPDPDLLIRTSGELRISNFLLWQLAYSELYFTSCLWPDFSAEELYRAIIDYQNRERRFGKTSEQISSK